jgi:hypothetical protein
MKIQLTYEASHQRPLTERKRQAGPLFNRGEDVLLSVGVPRALVPIHRSGLGVKVPRGRRLGMLAMATASPRESGIKNGIKNKLYNMLDFECSSDIL